MRYRCVLLFVFAFGCGRPKPMTGDYAEVDPDAVLTFEYVTPEFRVTAHRFVESQPFLVTVQTRRDNSLRYCMSDSAFEQALAPFEALKIKRPMGDAEYARLSKGFSYHRLRYTTAPPMEAFELVLGLLPNGHAAMPHDDAGYELTLPKSAVERLSQSCRNAHARAEPAR